jgi:hypothetical protein
MPGSTASWAEEGQDDLQGDGAQEEVLRYRHHQANRTHYSFAREARVQKLANSGTDRSSKPESYGFVLAKLPLAASRRRPPFPVMIVRESETTIVL